MASIININSKTITHIERSDIYKLLMAEIRKFPLLEKEEEESLIERYQASHNEKERIAIRNQLIQHNQRFIVSAAKQYANNNVDTFLELISEANIGFMEAIETFDKTKTNGRLLSWAAFYIRRSINMFLTNNQALIRQSNNAIMYHHLAKARNKLMQEKQCEVTDEEIMDYLANVKGLSVSNVQDVRKMVISSIDESYQDEESFNTTMNDFNSMTSMQNAVEAITEDDYVHALVKKGMECLNERDRDIFCMLYGLGNYCTEYSIEVVAEKYNFSRERVRQIHLQGLKKMAGKIKTAMHMRKI